MARFRCDEPVEAFQEFCLALLEDDAHRLRAYDPARSSLATYLSAIARNFMLTRALRFSRRRRHEFLDEFVAEHACESGGRAVARHELQSHEWHDPLRLILAKEKRRQSLRWLDTLGARDRELVWLTIFHEKDTRDVARQMGISCTTVYTKKHKLTRRMRDLMAA